MTDWAALHEQVVEAFAAGWREPGPHAWDALLAEDIELTQPLLRAGRGRALWQREVARLLAFLPDLRGEVIGWAGREDLVFITLRLTATLEGNPLAFDVVDRLHVDPAGVVRRRESFFDPTPVAMEVARRPGAWPSWWRSGLGPLLSRRHFLKEIR
jgi:SnoaL-like protein